MSVCGLQNINKAKKKHRVNVKNALISHANKDYQRTDKIRISAKKASSAFRTRTDKIHISTNKASSAFRRTDKGHMSYEVRTAFNVWPTTEHN